MNPIQWCLTCIQVFFSSVCVFVFTTNNHEPGEAPICNIVMEKLTAYSFCNSFLLSTCYIVSITSLSRTLVIVEEVCSWSDLSTDSFGVLLYIERFYLLFNEGLLGHPLLEVIDFITWSDRTLSAILIVPCLPAFYHAESYTPPHFYIMGGDKRFMLKEMVAMMVLMLKKKCMWAKQTFLWAKRASSPQELEFLGVCRGTEILVHL